MTTCGRYTFTFTTLIVSAANSFVTNTYSASLSGDSGITLLTLTSLTVLSFTNSYMLSGDCTERIEWNDTPDHTTLTYYLGN